MSSSQQQQQQPPSSSNNANSRGVQRHPDSSDSQFNGHMHAESGANTFPRDTEGWQHSTNFICNALALQTNRLNGYMSHWFSHLSVQIARVETSIAQQGEQIAQLHYIVQSLQHMPHNGNNIDDFSTGSQPGHHPPPYPPPPPPLM